MRQGSVLQSTLMIVLIAYLALGGAAGAEPPASPQLEATLLDGKPYVLADSRGAVVVLVLWSPNSLASRKSLPELQRFFTEYAPRGVAVVALSTTADIATIRRVADERGVAVPLGVLGRHDFGALPEARLPAVRVFDREGRLIGGHDGLFRLRDLQGGVDALLAR